MLKEKITIQQLLYSYYIKYDNLIPLINSQYGNLPQYKTVSHVNIFIDLYSIVRRLYSDDFIINDSLSLTSCIINMCGHYRTFFRNHYSTETSIYLVDGNNCSELNRKFYQGYNQGYAESIILNKRITELINKNRELLMLLSQYLPDIQYVGTNFETGVSINNIINTNRAAGNLSPNIIITKDIYLYQLVSSYNDKDIIIIRPKKYHGEDLSYIVNYSNVMHTYMQERHIKPDIVSLASYINPGLLTYIMSVTRLPERSMKSIVDIPKVIRLLSRLLNENIVLNSRNTDIDRLSNLLFQDEENQIPGVTIDFRFKAIDIIFQQSVFNNSGEKTLYTGTITNLYDPVAVNEINEKYFKEPIILDNL